MNRAGRFSGKSLLPLLLDRKLLLLLADDGGAEPSCECWEREGCLVGGDTVTVGSGGWLVRGAKGERGNRVGEGRVRPKKEVAERRERADGDDVAVWVERGVGGLGWAADCSTEVEKIAVNAGGAITSCGSRSVSVGLGFSSSRGGVSSSGIGTCDLVRGRRHRGGRCGLRVQHRVRRREAIKAKATGTRTVVRMIVWLRFPVYWLVDAIAMLVGILVTVVVGIVGRFEETFATVGEGDKVVELGFTAEDTARVECTVEAELGGIEDDSVGVVVINVNSCDPEDDDGVDTALELELDVG